MPLSVSGLALMGSHIACNAVMPGSGDGVMMPSLDVVLLESGAVHHNIVTSDGGGAVLEEPPELTMANAIATCNAALLDSGSSMLIVPESPLLAQDKHVRAVRHSAGKQSGARVLMEPSACANKYDTGQLVAAGTGRSGRRGEAQRVARHCLGGLCQCCDPPLAHWVSATLCSTYHGSPE